jgi:uncharacterized protein (DUF2267 family)
MATKYPGDKLPEAPSSWKAAVDRFAKTSNIHELKSAHSASEITVEQFLSLRVLWKNREAKKLNDDTRAGLYGSSNKEIRGIVHEKPEAGRPEIKTSWSEYLKAITALHQGETSGSKLLATSKMPEQLGVYALVLQSQLQASHMKASFSDSNKLSVTPLKPRYDLRGRAEGKTQGVQDKGRGSEPQAQIHPSPHRSGEDSSSGPRQVSPAAPGVTRELPVLDEQVVNTAATNFLNALFIHEQRRADWTLHRKQFKFQSDFVKFEARCDGHLQVHGHDRSAAILEVKPRPRYHEGGFRIEMQESAQMALWIYQEPNSHWTPPSGGDTY